MLQADPINEIGEVWEDSRDAVLVLAGFALLSALLIYAVVGRALRPLENLSTAFEQVGKDDYHRGLPEHGPPELMRLANGFNLMTPAARHGRGAEPPAERTAADVAGGRARRSGAGPA